MQSKIFVFVSIGGNEAWGGVELWCFNAFVLQRVVGHFYTNSSRTVCVWRRFRCPTLRANQVRERGDVEEHVHVLSEWFHDVWMCKCAAVPQMNLESQGETL